MGAQFICGSDTRRAQLRAPGNTKINGIDFLEVLDHRALQLGSPQQRTLVLRLFQPWTLGPNGDGTGDSQRNLVLAGGVRIKGLHILWAYRADQKHLADATHPNDLTPAEWSYFSTLPAPDHVLVVRTDHFGDASEYTLSVVDDAQADTPKVPTGWDPITSTVDFTFKAECPTPFDCAATPPCQPAIAPPPSLDYLAKDYSSFRKVLLNRLTQIMPDWQERSAADLGIVVVELLAYFGDYLSYYQDAVATEAYLGTARQRISVRRHARLLDYLMHEGASARAWVHFDVIADLALTRPPPPALPPKLYTSFVDSVYVDVDDQRVQKKLGEVHPLVFEPMHDAWLVAAHSEINFYTWQDESCCLPKGATRATLREGAARLVLMPGDVVIFEEVKGGANKDPADADPARRQAVRLTAVNPMPSRASDLPGAPRTPAPIPLTDPLTGQSIVEIEWHPDDALTMPFCISADVDGPVEDCSVARGNVVLCDHGASLVEPLPWPPDPTAPFYRPVLSQPELSHAVPYDPAGVLPKPDGSPPVSATATLLENPRDARPQVTLTDPTQPPEIAGWTAEPDLLESDRFAQDFVAELDDNGFTHLRFGDGVLGQVPTAALTATYRVGRGLAGNVGSEAIAHIDVNDAAIRFIRNPLPAQSGADPEPIAQVKLYAPQAFRVQDRAVTEADYAAAAERFAGVTRAVATRRWTGSWYTVFVTVERRGGALLDAEFKALLGSFLERYRMAGEDLELENPVYVPLDINLVICVAPGFFTADVEAALYQAFDDRVHEDGTRGFFHPDNFTFGQPVYLSQVINRAMQVSGVAYVDSTAADFRFQRYGQLARGEIQSGLIPMSRLEIARLQNSLANPENGQIGFELCSP